MANPIISLKSAEEYDIKVYRNDTMGLILTFLDEDSAPQDKSASDFEMQVRSADLTTLIDTFSVTSTDIVITDTNVVTIKGFDRLEYSVTAPVYDIQETTVDGEVITHFKGNLLIEKDVTI